MHTYQLVVADAVNIILILYNNDKIKVIDDEYTINQMEYLLTANSHKEEHKIKKLLTKVNKYE